MTDTITKADVLAAIDDEHANWDALVAEADRARMENPDFAGGWSFKDIVAHLSAWRERGLDRLEAISRGESEPPNPWPSNLDEDDDEGVLAINDWFYARDRDLPLDEVLRTASTNFDRLQNAIAALPEETLTDPNAISWTEGEALGSVIIDRSFFGHLHEEHEDDIRKWIASGG